MRESNVIDGGKRWVGHNKSGKVFGRKNNF
jgi:hypothetical protein